MKRDNGIAVILFTLIFSAVGFAQDGHNNGSQDKRESGKKVSEEMEKPAFEQSVDGIHVRFWFMTPAEHKKMMAAQTEDPKSHKMDEMSRRTTAKEMKQERKDAGLKEVAEAIMARTHQVIVTLTEEKTNTLLVNRDVSIELFSPRGKSRTTDLVPMMNHFGGGLTLVEKGSYLIAITLNIVRRKPSGYGLRTRYDETK